MKKILVAAMVLGLLAMGGAAWAADTQVTVTAVVTGTCQFLTEGTIDFALDPSTGGDVIGVVSQPTFWCTKNSSYTITDDDGDNASGTTHQMKHATLNEFIPYSFTYTDTGTGGGRSTTITLDIASTVVDADYANVSEGTYSDTVTLTVNP